MKKLLREPLVHFMAIGACLFLLYEFVAPDVENTDSKTIVVNRDALLKFVQFRSKAFNPEVAAERLDSMNERELALIVDDFVREEALYREALALGMDSNDYVIKQRLIQSIRFITNGFVSTTVDVSDEQVSDYFAANKDDYYVDPYATFTHVFFSSDRHGDRTRELAEAKLAQLNEERTPFSESMRHGDRFLYNANYVERGEEFVASHFGQSMARAVFAMEQDPDRWQGPVQSAYGYHVVMLTKRVDGRYPELAEVVDVVREDALRVEISERNERAVEAIIDTYDVRMEIGKAE